MPDSRRHILPTCIGRWDEIETLGLGEKDM